MKPAVNLSSKNIKTENEHIWTSFLCILLIVLFSANLYILWPGQMTPDSHAQYEMALHGNYNDHHPPLMSLVWGVLNHIYPGSGLLFLFHLILLYGAAAFLIFATNDKVAQLLFLFIPLLSPVSFYSSMIWKDVGFGAAYTFVFALLSYYILRKKRVSKIKIISVFAISWYGTAIKFQAQFALPFLMLLFSYWIMQCRWSSKTFLHGALYTVLMISAIRTVDWILIGKEGKLHSWQNVRLYDIAGIFKLTQKNFLPLFIKNHPRYSESKMASRFNYERVDDLTGTYDAPLILGSNKTERSELHKAWLAAILAAPIAYAQHRWAIFYRTLSIEPLERFDQLDLSSYEGLTFIRRIKQTADDSLKKEQRNEMLNYQQKITQSLFVLIKIIRSCSRLIIWIPLLILYLFIGIYFRRNLASAPLICMSFAIICFLGAIFFLTMASAIRYVYFVFCLIHSCHGLAYLAYTQSRRRLKTESPCKPSSTQNTSNATTQAQ